MGMCVTDAFHCQEGTITSVMVLLLTSVLGKGQLRKKLDVKLSANFGQFMYLLFI